MKAIIYTRGGNSDHQVRECERCARERGYNIGAIAKGPEELESMILGGDYSIVLVSNASRISRRQTEYLAAQRVFEALGIKIVVA